MMIQGLSPGAAAELRDTPADMLIDAHFGLGIDIRRDFGLWDGNRELLAACGEQQPDEATSVIIEATWRLLQGALPSLPSPPSGRRRP